MGNKKKKEKTVNFLTLNIFLLAQNHIINYSSDIIKFPVLFSYFFSEFSNILEYNACRSS